MNMSNKQMNLENGLNDIDDSEEIDWLTDDCDNYILDKNFNRVVNGSNVNELAEDEQGHYFVMDRRSGNYILTDADWNYIGFVKRTKQYLND